MNKILQDALNAKIPLGSGARLENVFQLSIVPVPPPEIAPSYPDAEALGLPRGLRLETDHDSWRCCACSTMQLAGSIGVWVPSGLRKGDSIEMFTEVARLSAFNGESMLWCLKCVPRIKPQRAASSPKPSVGLPEVSIEDVVYSAATVVLLGILLLVFAL